MLENAIALFEVITITSDLVASALLWVVGGAFGFVFGSIAFDLLLDRFGSKFESSEDKAKRHKRNFTKLQNRR